jgi:dihydrofolate reductase
MSVSLDGYISGPDGSFAWSVPDDELHAFHNDQVAELGAHLLGRRLYETMLYWETAHENPDLGATELEFARIWQGLPRTVVSSSLESVEGNAKLLRDGEGLAEEVARLRSESGADIAVGGAGLAATFIERDLVDEFRLFVNPVIVGGGTPFFPASAHRTDLELVETRTFGSRVTYTRYRRATA